MYNIHIDTYNIYIYVYNELFPVIQRRLIQPPTWDASATSHDSHDTMARPQLAVPQLWTFREALRADGAEREPRSFPWEKPWENSITYI